MLSALLTGITSIQHGGSYCLNCLPSFATENRYESHEKESKNEDLFSVIMPSKSTETLEFTQYQKSDKASFIVYADVECLIENLMDVKIILKIHSKVGEHIPSRFSMSTISSIKSLENKHDIYRGKYCMKNFCESLREHAMEITNFKKKNMNKMLLKNKQQKLYQKAKVCYICK